MATTRPTPRRLTALTTLLLLGLSSSASALPNNNNNNNNNNAGLQLRANPPSSSTSPSPSSSPSPPTVTLISSSQDSQESTVFIGRALPEFAQDLFLGIKYADEPRRFTSSTLKTRYEASDSDNASNAGTSASSTSTSTTPQQASGKNVVYYNATQYGYDCPGYGSDETTLVNAGLTRLSENCLSLNVVRPATVTKSKTQTQTKVTGAGIQDNEEDEELLPVMIWIFGGGWMQGATSDPRYNMSYILHQGALNGKPVVGVSINYRVAAFGFLDSKEVMESGNTNLGLRDQRVAMRWVKENIRAFGGDPEKITIWGESAGAYSVGAHLVTNDGNNEGLFRAAIMESGNAVGPPWNGTEWYQPMYDQIVNKTNCTTASDTLECLCEVPFETFYPLAYNGLEWFGTIDGTFIKEKPQISITEGRFAKVPILHGTNTDEGTSFGTTGTNTDEQCIEQLIASKRWVLDRDQATHLLGLYPNISAIGCPYGWGNVTWPSRGYQYKRYASMAGDLCMVAPRRLLSTQMAQYEREVYAYRWDVAALNQTNVIGVQHFAEIPFVFANPDQTITPLGANPARLALGNLAARMWTAFVTDLDPNGHGVKNIPQWPRYTPGQNPSNFVFRLPRTESYVEEDTYRAEGIEYINSIAR
ncbi:putative triacylglycerol lipase (LipA) [Aspergillus homomorphus CBS 101889]|uniref:Carboxylic ester hydrolase n=1 Tax=Aspergillus homomorphus (strain CBS 101889) TaxID=1450537 RepID=A0A395I5S0_ASPHC|nr:carboxylesterase [Aspergillus homomorphus CBS 101889]RAL13684.1 carboxylesterase [Aspergillus homomorphus CBS 101889]